MVTTLLWLLPVLLAGMLAGLFVARRLYRTLRAIVVEIYRRLESIQHEAAALRVEVGRYAATPRSAHVHATVDMGPLLRAVRTTNFQANEYVQAHLAALRDGSLAPPVIGYGLTRAMRAIEPLIIERESRDTIVCSLALGADYIKRVSPALASHQFYAETHGLSYALLSDTPPFMERPPAWMKIPLIMNLLDRGFDRVVYIDADALVTSIDFDINTVFRDSGGQGSITLTEDEDGVNSGVLFIEDGPAVRRILDLIWLYDADIHNGTWEQYALKTLMDSSIAVRRHVTIEPDPRRFNAFPVERNRFHRTAPRNTWRHGDFICHFSGIRSPELEPLLALYAESLAPLPYYQVAEP